MDDDFATLVERFAAAPGVNMVDLGIALFLEYFAILPLRFTRYVPLRSRVIMTPWVVDIQLIKQMAPPLLIEALRDDESEDRVLAEHPELRQPLRVIGRGLERRHAEINWANRVSALMLYLAVAIHALVLVTIIRSSTIMQLVMIMGGWFGAMIFAMVVCVTNQHWGSRIGFRRTSD